MRELKEILKENFYQTVGASRYISNVCTEGNPSIIKYGINPMGYEVKSKTAEITKISPMAIHVKVKGFGLSKKEFDIDFTEYENAIMELAKGDLSNLKFNWNIDAYFRDKDAFAMRFSNKKTYHDLFINYIVNDDILTRW